MRYQMKSFMNNIATTFFLLLVVFCASVLADEQAGSANKQTGIKPKPNYGPYPPADNGYVTDLADALTKDEEEEIEKWLWQTESKTNVEIAVVTILSIQDYPGADVSSIENFATGLFNTYGIGNMPKNDGVLLLVAVKDRKARIELGGGYQWEVCTRKLEKTSRTSGGRAAKSPAASSRKPKRAQWCAPERPSAPTREREKRQHEDRSENPTG